MKQSIRRLKNIGKIMLAFSGIGPEPICEKELQDAIKEETNIGDWSKLLNKNYDGKILEEFSDRSLKQLKLDKEADINEEVAEQEGDL